jgi:ribosome-binding factor A
MISYSQNFLTRTELPKLNLFVAQRRKVSCARCDRVATQLKSLIASALARGDFPASAQLAEESTRPCLVTITYVNLSADLRNATILYSPMNRAMTHATARFFERQARFFKDLVARKMSLKVVPNLIFKLDKATEFADRINELLKSEHT